MKRVAIYIRVSTQEQVLEGYSIQAQKERLINYCKAREWSLSEIFVDPGYSGKNLKRPDIQRLIQNIKNFNIVLVWRLDRLSRSQKDTMYLVEDVFLKNKVDILSLSESLDTSTPWGIAMIGILSSFSQLDRENIRERTKIGRRERAKEGLFHGGGFAPIGYDYIDGRLIVNEFEALQIKEIFNLYLQGYGQDRIIDTLNSKGYRHKYGTWNNRATIMRVLSNPLYTGKISKEFQGLHIPIVSEEDFNQIQSIRKGKRDLDRKYFQYSELLSGLIFCDNCGARYYVKKARSRNNTYKYYECYSRGKINKEMIKDPDCNNRIIRVEELNSLIEEEILKISLDREVIDSIISPEENNQPDRKEIIEKEINGINRQINKLLDLYQIDSIPLTELNKRMSALASQKQSLEQQTKEIENCSQAVVKSKDDVLQILLNFPFLWEKASFEEKRNIINILINKIIIREKIFIDWSFQV
jgi:site-specific DNA recombinase